MTNRKAARTSLLLLQTVLLQANALDRDEPSGVHGAEVVQRIHRCLFLAIQLLGLARSSQHVCVALVKAQTNLTIDALLTEQQRVLDKFPLGAEVHAVVELVAPAVGNELIAKGADLGVHDETFEIQMGKAQDRHGRGIIATAGFETNKAVLNDVNATNAVCVTNLVQEFEQLYAVGVGLVASNDSHWNTLLELDGDVLRLVGRVEWRVGHSPHVVWGRLVRVFEDASFVAAVCEIGVHGPRLRLCGCDGDAVFGSVVEEVLSALELVAELRKPPRCDNLDRRLESVAAAYQYCSGTRTAGCAHNANSNRTWSLPLPVQPWLTQSQPSS